MTARATRAHTPAVCPGDPPPKLKRAEDRTKENGSTDQNNALTEFLRESRRARENHEVSKVGLGPGRERTSIRRGRNHPRQVVEVDHACGAPNQGPPSKRSRRIARPLRSDREAETAGIPPRRSPSPGSRFQTRIRLQSICRPRESAPADPATPKERCSESARSALVHNDRRDRRRPGGVSSADLQMQRCRFPQRAMVIRLRAAVEHMGATSMGATYHFMTSSWVPRITL